MIEKRLNDYRDRQDFIVHGDPSDPMGTDPGDASQRTFSEPILLYPGKNSIKFDIIKRDTTRKMLLVNSGKEPVRYWDSDFWAGTYGTMSRDNWTPMWLANLLYRVGARFGLWKRLGFMWNTKDLGKDEERLWRRDWIGLANISQWFRFNRMWIVCNLTDITIFFQALIIVATSWVYEKPGRFVTTNDLNLRLHLICARIGRHSILSFAASLIYQLRRQAGDENGRYTQYSGPDSAWHSYFRHDAAPPMYKLLPK